MPRSTAASNNAILVFVAIAFCWALLWWTYWLWAMPPGGLVLSQAFMASAIIGGFGPSLAGLVMAWREGHGRLLALLSSVFDWGIGRGNTLLALLLVPAVTALAALLVSVFARPAAPDPTLIPVALAWPILAALGEELGWRGWLLPRLAERMSLLRAALVIGLIWGLWHLPADFVGLKAYGAWFWLAFLINGPLVLTAHSIIIAWLWERSDRRLWVALLYHASITASAILTPALPGNDLFSLAPAAIGAALLWLVAAFVAGDPHIFPRRRTT